MERLPGPDALRGAGSIDSSLQTTEVVLLPNSLANLIDAEKVLHATDLVSPTFFVEVFAGCAALSLGMVLKNIPTVKPWDIRHGEEFDVLSHGKILFQLFKQKTNSASAFRDTLSN